MACNSGLLLIMDCALLMSGLLGAEEVFDNEGSRGGEAAAD
jgi:hypothetical protein